MGFALKKTVTEQPVNETNGLRIAAPAVVVTGGLLLANAANAAAVDVAAVVTDIGAQAAPIGLIGAAVLLIFVGVKAFQWVRKALS